MSTDRSGTVQYAALPWRRRGAGVEVLLITSRRTRRWIIPKGWPMQNRTPAETAAQEAYEEAGVRGRIGEAIGAYTYDKRLREGAVRRLTVEVFPLEVAIETGAWPEADQRTRRWHSQTEAAEAVNEPDLAELIRGFSAESAPPRT